MNSDYIVAVLVNDKAVKKYHHQGEIYIEGRPKSQYKIRIYNFTDRRAEAVVSVDGLSVIDGKPASEYSEGYLVEPYSHVDIDGWRINMNEVSAFTFGKAGESYATHSGHAENVGVIGVVVYPERRKISGIVYRETYRWPSYRDPFAWTPAFSVGLGISNVVSAYNITSSVVGSQDSQNLGTEWGETKASPVTSLQFDRDWNSSQYHVIYYDDRKGLERRGIKVDVPTKPNPFPAGSRFCTPPE